MSRKKQQPSVVRFPNPLSEKRKEMEETERLRRAAKAEEQARISYKVVAPFNSIEDAQAAKELMAELGIEVAIEVTQNNKPLSAHKKEREHLCGETRLGKRMLEYMRREPGRIYTAADFANLLLQHDYAPSSASVMLTKMAQEIYLTRVDRGEYMIPGPDCDMIINRRYTR